MASSNATKVLAQMEIDTVQSGDAMLAEGCLRLLEDLGTDGSEVNVVDDCVEQLRGHLNFAADGTDCHIVQRVEAYLNPFRGFFPYA